MVYFGWGRWLRTDVNYDTILTVCDLIRQAHDQKPRIRKIYYRRVVEILTTGTGWLGRRIRWYHYLLVLKVLKAADMLSEEKVQNDPRAELMAFVNWLAPRLGVTPREIMTQFNASTLFDYYSEAISFHMQRELARGIASHAPLKYHEIMSELYQYKAEGRVKALKARNEEIDETEREPDTRPMIDSLGHAFDY